MNYRRLGSAGLKVSELSLGAWVTYGGQVGEATAEKCMTAAYEAGVNFFDRAALKGFEWIRDGLTPERIGKLKQLEPVAADLGCSLAQLAIAWCLKNPNVSTVITGASRVEQVHQNLKALEVVPRLTADVMEQIDRILGNKPKGDED